MSVLYGSETWSSRTEERAYAEDVRKQGAEEDIWAPDGGSNRTLNKSCIMRSFKICTSHQILIRHYNETGGREGEMGAVCDTYEGKQEFIQSFEGDASTKAAS
jgi:hypothetical protein